jgi:hypothetical protein
MGEWRARAKKTTLAVAKTTGHLRKAMQAVNSVSKMRKGAQSPRRANVKGGAWRKGCRSSMESGGLAERKSVCSFQQSVRGGKSASRMGGHLCSHLQRWGE